MFQYLIGRLKTKFKSWSLTAWRRFQYLIGRLKTSKIPEPKNAPWVAFQYLIGRLKTEL